MDALCGLDPEMETATGMETVTTMGMGIVKPVVNLSTPNFVFDHRDYPLILGNPQKSNIEISHDK
jgi:hypothetical protein